MNEDAKALARAARQLIETDQILGGAIPAGDNPLPAPEPKDRPGPSEADAAAGTPQQKAAVLEAMDAAEVRDCVRCQLSTSRTRTVFGEGDPDARLVFVGEGPGADEDRTGRPFVGRAGEKLAEMIGAMGLRREDVFICNLVKCRPPGNRAPMPDEVAACWGYLVRQLQIIRPEVIVTLGNPATHSLLDTRVGITRMRGQWQPLPAIGEGLAGTAVMPTFHPAYLLRQYTPENRRKVWEDLKKVMAKLGLKRPGLAK